MGHVAHIHRFCDGTLMRTDPGSDTKRKRNAFITIVEREFLLPRALTKRLVNHARPSGRYRRRSHRLGRRALSRACTPKRAGNGRTHGALVGLGPLSAAASTA